MKINLTLFSLGLVSTTFVFSTAAKAQDINKIIKAEEVEKIEKVLAGDEMRGRKAGSPEIDKAADFISNEFKNAGLQKLKGAGSYLQPFEIFNSKVLSSKGNIGGVEIPSANIIALTKESSLKFDEKSGYEIIKLDTTAFFSRAFQVSNAKVNTLVLVDSANAKNFSRLKRLNRDGFGGKPAVVYVLSNADPAQFSFEVQQEVSPVKLANVAGMVPGTSRKNEMVIFSAHYDHIGVGKPTAAGDSIYNGANDDAAGTTAVILLAKYFAKQKNNARTLVFVTFTAEESGGYGSQYFSNQINPDSAVAMFNIEMIGTESKWGKNSAYITGYEKSDFGKILQGNLTGSAFTFHPDPYPDQQLFYRSDNATLAALGVPAHTISTSKMDSEKFYHTADDEIETLDMQNMTEIIKAIAISSKGIVSGKETPSRVEKVAE